MTISGNVSQSNLYTAPNRIFGGYYRVRFCTCNPKMGHCYNPKCRNPECRQRYRWSVRKRIGLGINKAVSDGLLLRLITFVPLDSKMETYQLDVIEQLKSDIQEVCCKFMAKVRRKVHKELLMWWRIWGLKQKSYPHQLHVHQLFTCTTEYDPLTNSTLMSWLIKLAKNYNLRVHMEEVTDPIRIASYMADKNLSELDDIDLPPRFQRFQCSHNAPKMTWQIRKALRRKVKELQKRLIDYINILADTFPIQYWEHWCKLLICHWSCVVRQVIAGNSQPHRLQRLEVYRRTVAWFILHIANLWEKIHFNIGWLRRMIDGIDAKSALKWSRE